LKNRFSSYWVRSAFYSFFQRFSLTFFGLINFMILTRTISENQLGTWALFLIITGVFEATKSNLLKNAHVKYVSGSPDKNEKIAIASSSFLINTCISLLFVLAIIFFSEWLSQWLNAGLELAQMLVWFIPGMLFMIFFTHFESVQQSHLDFKGVFAGYFIRQIFFFLVLLIYWVLKKPLSLPLLAIYQSLSIALGSIVLYVFSKKYLSHQFIASWPWSKKIIGYGGYIFGSGLVANIANNLDQVMIARYVPGSVAYYNVASRINNLVDMPSYAAADIIFPKASLASVEEGPARVKYLFERMIAILIAITIPLALFIILFPKFITTIIAGAAYTPAAGILQIYMVTGILRPAQNQAANLLNSIGKPRITFIMNTISLSILLLLNYICLKEFGFYGAAIGTLITTLISFITWYFLMRRMINLDLSSVLRHIISSYRLFYQQAKGILTRKRKNQEPEQEM
jgi:lipopolysaccharide exporter